MVSSSAACGSICNYRCQHHWLYFCQFFFSNILGGLLTSPQFVVAERKGLATPDLGGTEVPRRQWAGFDVLHVITKRQQVILQFTRTISRTISRLGYSVHDVEMHFFAASNLLSSLRCTLAELSTALGSGSEVPRRAGWSSSSVEKCGFDNVEKCGARVWSRQCWAAGFPGSPGKIGCRARPVPPTIQLCPTMPPQSTLPQYCAHCLNTTAPAAPC